MRCAGLLIGVLVAGCTGEIQDGQGGGPDGAVATGELAIMAPQPGSVHVRDTVGALGALVAAVDLEVEAGAGIERVAFEAGGVWLTESTAASARGELTSDGAVTIVATGFDGTGQVVATASVEVTVEAPRAADCHAWLDLYGLTYELGPDRQGVAQPVTLTTPINGVAYRYVSNEAPRDTFFMDCSLAHSLARAAPILRARDILEVADIGVYNYRCIGGGTPPDCPNGVSQHAYATAIDIAGFTDGLGTWYSVNDDWLIDTDPTCEAATEGDKDALLHEVICELKAAGVWNIVLTPNYNDAHRNHFHVDLSPGSDFIRSRGLVDVGPDNH